MACGRQHPAWVRSGRTSSTCGKASRERISSCWKTGPPYYSKRGSKLASGRISEIDTTVVRNQADGMIFRPDQLKTASPAMNLTPERSQLNTREEMTRLALLYPAGLRVG